MYTITIINNPPFFLNVGEFSNCQLLVFRVYVTPLKFFPAVEFTWKLNWQPKKKMEAKKIRFRRGSGFYVVPLSNHEKMAYLVGSFNPIEKY